MTPLLDPSLDPLFWDNLRATASSAWHGHVPFAHWLVAALQPRRIVELGTHNGVSYAAMCQAVQRGGFACDCTAVDSWAGDDHAGAYGGDIYLDFSAFNDAHFAGFSRLMRCSFDDAVEQFEDGSIDVLHIDGFHTYEAVRHDFETWRGKLSDRAVVLFHDTDVRVRDFGVWRFWAEIRDAGVGSLEFSHAFGLGVLMMGPDAPPALTALCRAPLDQVRARFAALGERHVLAFERVRVPEDEPETAATPVAIDPDADCGVVAIAERFAAPPGLCAIELPRDAVTRTGGGCTVWVVSDDGHAFRHGIIHAAPEGDSVTLAFAPFGHARPRHFHLFVTAPCARAMGLPAALAQRLATRRAPIGVNTPMLDLPDLPPTGLYLHHSGRLDLTHDRT